MKLIRYVEIENFKGLKAPVKIDLEHPAVLIGPNNAGKTSVIQALALWSRGINTWYERNNAPKQKESSSNFPARINRLNILEVPVAKARLLWSDTHTRRGKNIRIKINICVGIEYEGKVMPCRLEFTCRDNEVIHCKPCPDTINQAGLIEYATGIKYHLLYPMSGIETEEPLIREGRINVLLGQGQTAQVLRNLCYSVLERDRANGSDDWQRIVELTDKLFGIGLSEPLLNENRGTLELQYTQPGIDRELDISVAGRGLQQMLLILAYMYSHKNSVLMVDEPDAHLEVLRQKQVFEILKDIADENGCQVIVATHSEVILDDAIETNLTLLINGISSDLAKRQDIQDALKKFSIDHYYKASICPRILYIEGSTDFDILRSLAAILDHPAHDVLTERLNYYYTRNIHPDNDLHNRLEQMGGGCGENIKRHFFSMKRIVPEFRGLAILDSDGRTNKDEKENDLLTTYWKHYEIENYFISPDSLIRFIEHHFNDEGGLFTSSSKDAMQVILDTYLLREVFNSDEDQLLEFSKASRSLKNTLLKHLKMSALAEYAFEEFANQFNQPLLLRKGEYYKLVKFCKVEDLSDEVTEKLDMIVERLKSPPLLV
ncbi:MAG: AAA family ATPase [Candidatus Sabulitectum sp.]|nr:AAA family ATPase [Candidatus Sabulitectum sp.]